MYQSAYNGLSEVLLDSSEKGASYSVDTHGPSRSYYTPSAVENAMINIRRMSTELNVYGSGIDHKTFKFLVYMDRIGLTTSGLYKTSDLDIFWSRYFGIPNYAYNSIL